MSIAKSTYDEIDDFFRQYAPGAKKSHGRLFVALNYKGDFSRGLNTKENPDTIKNEPMYQLMLAKNYAKDDDEVAGTDNKVAANVLSQKFVDVIKDFATHHKTMQADNDGPKFLPQIKNIADLSDNGKQFYSQLINLKNDADRGITTAFGNPFAGNTQINLLKTVAPKDLSSKAGTVFGSTLPYLPAGMVLPDGTTRADVDYLHKVYDTELTGVTALRPYGLKGGDPSQMEPWVEYNDPNTKKLKQGSLDPVKFARACTFVTTHPSPVSQVKGEFDELYDMATSQLYKKNASGQITDMDGKLVGPDEYAKAVAENCSNTFTKDKDCELVFECLLLGDPQKLANCLAKLSLDEIFEVAKDEYKQMHPTTLLKLLSTFSVEYKNGKCEEFLEWTSSLEGRLRRSMTEENAAKTARAILNNKKLRTYIQHIMSIVRSNSALIDVDGELSDLPKKNRQ